MWQSGKLNDLWPKSIWVEAAVVLVILLILGLPNLVYPFGTDQGEYAQIASEMLKGKVVYRDVFNVKPPVTHLLHAISQEIFGRSMLSLRVLDWGWQAATGVVVALLTGLLYRRRYAPLLAGVLYGVFYYRVDFWHSAQTDGFVNLPATLGVLFFLLGLRRDRALYWILAGAFVGIGVLTKYPIGLLFPFMLLVLILVKRIRRENLIDAGRLLLGFSLPVLVFVIISGLRGSMGPFLDIQLGYIPAYNSGFSQGQSYLNFTWSQFVYFWDLKNIVQLFVVVWLAEVLLSGLQDEWPREQWIVPLWGIVGFIFLVSQNKYYDYHMHVILPPLAIMLAHSMLNLDALVRHYLPRFRFAVTMLAVAIPFLILLWPFSPYLQEFVGPKISNFWAVASGERSLEEQYSRGGYGTYGWGYSAQAILEARDYLQANTSPEDEIFVWGFEPAVYFLSERDSASRFLFNFPLYGNFAWPEYRDEFLDEMENNSPEMILVARNDAVPWVSGTQDDSLTAFEKFEPFKSFVDREYKFMDQVAQFTIYARRSEQQP